MEFSLPCNGFYDMISMKLAEGDIPDKRITQETSIRKRKGETIARIKG